MILNMHSLGVGLFICVLLAAGYGAVISKSGLKREYCSWGAQYWCSSPKTAGLCGKTEWCAANSRPQDGVEQLPCSVAQKLVKLARSSLGDSEAHSEYDIALKLAKACTMMTDPKERRQCKTLATKEDTLLKLLQLVDTQLSTKTVAVAVGACAQNVPTVEVKECTKCQDVLSATQVYIGQYLTLEVYKKAFEGTCTKLGPGKQICQFVAERKYKMFYDGLLSASADTVCEGHNKCLGISPAISNVQSSDLCTTCKSVVADIRALDRSQDVQDVIRNVIKSVCTKLGQLENVCNVLADEGLQYVFEIIATEMEPVVVCETLDLCSVPVQTKTPVARTALSFEVPIPRADASVPCIVCQMALEQIEGFLAKNSTEQTLESFLSEICNRLPSTISDECNKFVNQYGPIVIELLEKKLNPDLVCTALGLCKNSSSKDKLSGQVSSAASDELCDLCKYVVTYLDTFLEKNSTEAEIEVLLDKVCTILPSSLTQQCEAMVKQYGPLMIQLLLAELDPTKVCTAIGLCTGNPATSIKSQAMEKVNGPGCALCEYVMKEMDKWLAENSTESEMETLLEKVCTLLPTSIQKQCESFVQQYGPMIIQLLLQELDPSQVCTVMKLCTGNKVSTVPTLKSAVKQPNDERCDLCKYVVTYIDTFLKENDTEAEIEELLNKTCTILPSSLRQQCDGMVEQYGPLIIQLLLQELDPTKVCTVFGLCTGNKVSTVPTLKCAVKQPNDELCELCKYVVTYIDTYLKENATEAEIEELLNKTCTILPSSLRQQCDGMVEQYGPLIIQLLLQELDPTKVCTVFGLCTGNKVSTVPTLKSAVKQPNDELCELCKYVVTYIDTYLKENATEAEIEELLNKTCTILPSSLRQQCDGMVEQYGPLIIQLLLQELDPTKVCTVFGLCTGNKVSTVPTLKCAVKQPNDELCELCKYVVTYIDTYLKENATEAEIEELLNKTCTILPSSLRQQCEGMVEQYGPLIIQLLLQELDPTKVCTVFGLCTGNKVSTVPTLKSAVKQPNDELCELCKYVVTYIDTYLKENATEAEIEELLNKTCTILPSSLRQQCEGMVEQYGPLIIQLLLQELDPTKVCTVFGLCTGNKVSTVPTLKSAVKQPNDELCELCKYVVTYIDTYLKENATEAEIEELLNKTCTILPSSLRQQCEGMVEQYGPLIIQLLLQELDPTKVCTVFGLCTGNKVSTVPTLKSAVKQPNDELCELCKYVVTYIDTYLKENATEAEIEELLNKTCTILPSSLRQQCDGMVEQYGPLIIQLLLQELDPTKVCTVFGLCTGNKVSTVPTLKSAVKQPNDELCELCKYVVTYIDTYLKENATESEIEALLNKTCTILPSSVKQQCESFVKQYGPMIIDLLLKELDPTKVCTYIGLCTGNKVSTVPTLKSAVKQSNDELCELCKYVVTYIDTYLKENATESEIEELLNKTCTILPSSVKQQCESFVKQYGPMIIDLLLKELDPTQVCTAIGLCTGNPATSIKSQAMKKVNGPECVLCEFVMKELDELLAENRTQAQIEDALKKVCYILPSTVKHECIEFLATYGAFILQLLVQEVQPQQMCAAMGLCSANRLASKPQQLESSASCALCELILSKLDSVLGQNTTEAEIQAALDKVCDVLPASLNSDCQTVVEQYAPIILHLLIQKMDPKLVCTEMRLCSAKTIVMTSVSKVNKQKTELCAICESVMQMVENILKEQSTKTEIISALDTVCDLLPGQDKELCHTFLPMYFGYVVDLIEQEIPPKLICKFLKVCIDDELKVIAKEQSPRPGVKKGELCPLCVMVLQKLDKILETNASKQDIIVALDKVCDILSDPIKVECESFVGLYLPYVVDLIVQGLSPEKICKELNLCVSQTKSEMNYLTHDTGVSLKKDELCPLCIYVFTAVDQLLESNATEPDIEKALDHVCNILVPLKDQCEKFVALYTPYVVDLILKELTPQQICHELGLCTNTTVIASPNGNKPLIHVTSDPECAICELIMKYMEALVAKNTSVSDIESALDKVCDILPSTVRADCLAFVSSYTPEMVSMLSHFPPDQVCALIKACQLPPLSVQKAVLEKATMSEKPTPKGDNLCILCEFIATTLENLLLENDTESQLIAALGKVCHVLPSTMTEECKSEVDEYGRLVIKLLIQKLKPSQICSILSLCPSTKPKLSLPDSWKKSSFNGCSLCQLMMDEIELLLKQPFVEVEVEKALTLTCDQLPSEWRTPCDDLVQMFTPNIVDFIIKGMAPKEFCQFVSLCERKKKDVPKKANSLTFMSETKEPATTPNYMEYCSLCKFALYDVQNVMSDPFWQNKSKVILYEVCSYLTTGQDACHLLVDMNFNDLVNEISAFLFPIEFCQKIELCEPPASVLKLAGPECGVCKVLVQLLDTFLQKNTTVMDVEKVFNATCEALIPAAQRAQCEAMVRQYTPTFMQLLAQLDDPTKVCQATRFCPNTSQKYLHLTSN